MQIFGMSDIGLKRESNQDVFYCYKNDFDECFAFVCDGMGGQNGGDVASSIVLDVFSKKANEEFNKILGEEEIKNLVFDFYKEANRKIYEKSYEIKYLKGMGTTCTAVFVKKKKILVFSVGDSRMYVKKNGILKQETIDHSYVQTLVDCGKITEEEAKFHPRKNEITKAVGIMSDVEIDFKEVEVFKGDLVLLCTDGLTNSCSDLQINNLLDRKEDIEKIVNNLINLSNLNGGQDNITVILIKI